MSLVWIKVDREKKTHSIYSDGIQRAGDVIVCHDECKFKEYKDYKCSILLGTTGNTHCCNYIQKYFFIKFKNSNLQYNTDRDTMCCDISELFETLDKEYREKYNEPLDNSVILSINGILFKVYNVTDDTRWFCTTTNENFVCCGSPTDQARTLLYYNENIAPQDLLNAVAKVTDSINTNLFKLENINYE